MTLENTIKAKIYRKGLLDQQEGKIVNAGRIKLFEK